MKRTLTLTVAIFAALSVAAPPTNVPSEKDYLKNFVGRWTTKTKLSKDEPCRISSNWTLGGRHLLMKCSGMNNGMKMDGMLFLSWDETTGSYVSTWFDGESGHPVMGHGNLSGDTLTTVSEPMKMGAEMLSIRMIIEKRGNDAFNLSVGSGNNTGWKQMFSLPFTREKW